MFIVYVLKSQVAPKSYVGYTSNLDRRLSEHNAGKSSYTSKYVPWVVIHKELFSSAMLAKQREKFLKSRAGRNFLKIVFSKLI